MRMDSLCPSSDSEEKEDDEKALYLARKRSRVLTLRSHRCDRGCHRRSAVGVRMLGSLMPCEPTSPSVSLVLGTHDFLLLNELL